MKQNFKRIAAAATSLMVLPLLVVAPAYAHEGNDRFAIMNTATETTTSTSTGGGSVNGYNEESNHSSSEVKNRLQQFSQKGEDAVKELEANKTAIKLHTEQERQKSCQARSAEITQRLNKKVASAVKYKSVFDGIFSKVTAFHDSKQLNTPNYDTLVANVKTAQANADTAIATLKGFDTTIDCTKVDAATTQVAAFREALGSTRDALKAYRDSIKTLLVAVKNSIPDTTSTSTSSTTNTTTSN